MTTVEFFAGMAAFGIACWYAGFANGTSFASTAWLKAALKRGLVVVTMAGEHVWADDYKPVPPNDLEAT